MDLHRQFPGLKKNDWLYLFSFSSPFLLLNQVCLWAYSQFYLYSYSRAVGTIHIVLYSSLITHSSFNSVVRCTFLCIQTLKKFFFSLLLSYSIRRISYSLFSSFVNTNHFKEKVEIMVLPYILYTTLVLCIASTEL